MGIMQVLFISLLLAGCAQGHCRRQVDAPAAAQPLAPPAAAASPVLTDADHVLVYKYDGSLQCGMGKPIDLDTMAKDLKGIMVSSSVKKNDGLMHIQVCGSTTGMANVYEIPAKTLKKAEAKGFKKWSFE